MKYSGRHFTVEELETIREWIAHDPKLNRAELSRRFCRTFNWLKINGGLKDMSCRVAMLRMQDDHLLQLPKPQNKAPCSKTLIKHTELTRPQTTIDSPVHQLSELTLHRVVGRRQAALWNEYIDRYHYLGHKPLPGAQLRYFIKTNNEQIMALIGFGAAAWKIAPRDNLIGWTPQQREKQLHFVVNNARFLILPWIQSKNLASKILGLVARQLPTHWQEQYGYKPLLFETFVELQRFTGTCYKAANWFCVGETTGRGKCDRDKKATRIKKLIWLYPLDKSYKSKLCRD